MTAPWALYVETSAVLRAVLERGTTPGVEAKIRGAKALFTSRLSVVEARRAFLRLRGTGRIPEKSLADAEREVEALWARCQIWELTRAICDAASHVAPQKPLRTLDALHLATFLAARRLIDGLEMLTVDARLLAALV
ncbi:MAG: type II toxin-antitoxin system VapC family toxin [Planctomycetes bacterium]|nr:type II toxin-antitoxin system VapC family toxin [Planctomycetota bacterium]